MPTRKTTIESETGVRPEMIEQPDGDQAVERRAHRLRRLRLRQPRPSETSARPRTPST